MHNGTLPAPPAIDWLCVSSKAGAPWVQKSGEESKLVYPQAGLLPDEIAEFDFQFYLLQPMVGPDRDANTHAAIAYCQANPRWRLSLQTHKIMGIR